MSVFISWAGADREVKNVIAARLREEKIEYWESDEYCCEDFSKECIRNIRRSNLFIVIVSEASMDEHSYVFNEVIEARRMENEGLLNILVYKLTDAPYTERFAMQLNHLSDANHVARVMKLGGSGGLDSLMTRTKFLLKRREEGFPEKPYDVLLPKILGNAVGGGRYFVPGSRDGLLSELGDAFDTSGVVILSGLFGFGKRSLIRHFLETRRELSAVEVDGMGDPVVRFFLNRLTFTNVNSATFDKGNDRDALVRKFELLQKLDERHVLVISDVDFDGEVDEFLVGLLASLRCHVVLITQSSAEAYEERYPVIRVGRMENEALAELFFHYYNRVGQTDREALRSLLELFFEDVGGHTRTVELTASVLSRELRADPEELPRYLTPHTEDTRALEDKILDRTAELFLPERFSEEEQKVLFLIALLADPTVSEKHLRRLMETCDVYDPSVITSLDSHRWVTYEGRSGGVRIEKVVAQICLKKLPPDYQILTACLSYFSDRMVRVLATDGSMQDVMCAKLENFFSLLQLDVLADAVGNIRTMLYSGEKDVGGAEAIVEHFEEVYGEPLRTYGELLDRIRDADPEEDGEPIEVPYGEWEAFELSAALMVSQLIIPTIKLFARTPTFDFFSFSSTVEPLKDDLKDLFTDEETEAYVRDIVENGSFTQYIAEATMEGEAEDAEALLIILCCSILSDFSKRDFSSMTQKLDECMELLEGAPELLKMPEVARMSAIVVQIIYTISVNTGSYQTGVSFYERILLLDWPVAERYQILMNYAGMLLAMKDEIYNAVAVLEEASAIFDDAVLAREADGVSRDKLRRTLLMSYAYASTLAEEPDAAAEKLAEARQYGYVGVEADAVQIIGSIVDRYLYMGETDSAVSLIETERSFLTRCIENERIDGSVGGSAVTLLALSEMKRTFTEGSLGRGGVVVDLNYYQRYSSDKKNNLFLMMSYNRVADGVKRFDFTGLSDGELAVCTEKLRARARAGESKMKLAPEAFALVSEAGFRVLGYRHHRVQYVGAAAMLDGKIAEILNGEGKTYTIPLVAFVHALYGETAFVFDDSRYLTERNYRWMRGIYGLLGLKVGYMPPTRSNEPFAPLRDADVVYADFFSFGISVLREELYGESRYDLGGCTAIIDEADSILVESAMQKVQIVGNPVYSAHYARRCRAALRLLGILGDEEIYYERTTEYINLKREIYPLIESCFGVSVEDLERSEELEQIENLVRQAIWYCLCEKRDEDYFVMKDGHIFAEDTRNGALIEVNAVRGYLLALYLGLPTAEMYEKGISEERVVYDTTYVYGLLKRFGSIAGTSATVHSFKKEFKSIYGLEVVAIPTVLPIKRTDESVTLFTRIEYKDEAILDMIEEKHENGQPVLLIVPKVKEAKRYSALLTERGIAHTVLSAVNSEKSPEILAEAGVPGSILVATQIVNRGVDIKLGGDAERMTLRELVDMGVDVSRIDDVMYAVPTDEVRASELYRVYTAVNEKNRAAVEGRRRQVIESGGLCVISSDPYSDMRVEQQIRGRAGRQGAVGESYVFESVEDEIFSYLLGDRRDAILQMIEMIGAADLVDAKILRRSVENAKVRLHHASFRRMLGAAEVSDRIDRSRAEIFRLRDGILDGSITADDLIGIWSTSPSVVQQAKTLASGQELPEATPVSLFWICYADRFAGVSPSALPKLLSTVAKEQLKNRAESSVRPEIAVAEGLLRILSDHLTAMEETDASYAKGAQKNTEKLLSDVYRRDLSDRIARLIGDRLVIGI